MKSARPLVIVALLATIAGCGGSGAGPHAGGTTGSGGASGMGGSPPIKVLQVAHSAGFDPSAIYSRDAPGVVTVISTFPAGVLPGVAGASAAQGSGFVISSNGEILTNAHVVTSADGSGLRRASAVYIQFRDDNEVPARIIGTDPNADVALLRIDPAGLSLKPLALGSSSNLIVGAPVATLGTPFGKQDSLSVGVISATNRAIPSLNGPGGSSQGTFATLGAIQTDAAINHGNSGGPLVDAGGAVIGINSQLAPDPSGVSAGVGFAVPVDAAKRALAQLRAHGTVSYAYVGVSSQDLFPQLARRLHLSITHGSMISSVAPGSPAARAGLQAGTRRITFDAQPYLVGGDIITKLNSQELSNDYGLVAAVTQVSPGQTVTLEVWRGASKRQVRLRLGTRPSGG